MMLSSLSAMQTSWSRNPGFSTHPNISVSWILRRSSTSHRSASSISSNALAAFLASTTSSKGPSSVTRDITSLITDMSMLLPSMASVAWMDSMRAASAILMLHGPLISGLHISQSSSVLSRSSDACGPISNVGMSLMSIYTSIYSQPFRPSDCRLGESVYLPDVIGLLWLRNSTPTATDPRPTAPGTATAWSASRRTRPWRAARFPTASGS